MNKLSIDFDVSNDLLVEEIENEYSTFMPSFLTFQADTFMSSENPEPGFIGS
jgi:hypothetical protein